MRYAVVGLASNLALYLAFISLTYLGIGHKFAMTLVYATGVFLTFIFNKNWTFGHKRHISSTFIRYVSIYAIGYLLNLGGLYFWVDKLGYSYKLVQGILIVLIAALLFLLQKYFVFTKKNINESP